MVTLFGAILMLTVPPVAPMTAVDNAATGGQCFYVKASTTSNSIPDLHHYSGQSAGHYVCPPSYNGPYNGAPQYRGLFLFLPGTAPNSYKQIVETASAAGYHAIGLQWDDFPCVAVFCAEKFHVAGKGNTNESAACAHNSEIMRFFGNKVGVASNSAVNVLPVNSVVGGHSRGSDYPLMLSKRVAFKRGLFFGGPGQEFLGNCSGSAPSATNCNPAKGFGQAAWVTEMKSHLAAQNMYGLLAGYPGDACNMATPVWKLLGLPGAAAIDNATVSPRPSSALAAELAGARRLYDTSVCLHAPSPHMCMISEAYGPLDSHGRHKMIPIWQYMLTNDAGATPAAIAKEPTVNCTMAARPSTFQHTTNRFNYLGSD
eukprot:gene13655-10520_t